jgi:hypothetical protein
MRRSFVVVTLLIVAAGCGTQERTRAPHTVIAPSGPVVARVGDVTVTVGEVETLLADAERSFRKQGRPSPTPTDDYYLDLRDQAVSYLVEAAGFRQEASRIGVEVDAAAIDRELRRTTTARASARAHIERRLLDHGVFEALVGRADERDDLGPIKRKWKAQVNALVASARYADGWKPAEKLRSPTPPELQGLPKPRGPCDLKNGTFTLREMSEHGCVQAWGIPIPGVDGSPCPEIPVASGEAFGFSEEETQTGYFVWGIDDNAPSCVGYPSTTFTVSTGRGPCYGGPPVRPSKDGLCAQTWVSAN